MRKGGQRRKGEEERRRYIRLHEKCGYLKVTGCLQEEIWAGSVSPN